MRRQIKWPVVGSVMVLLLATTLILLRILAPTPEIGVVPTLAVLPSSVPDNTPTATRLSATLTATPLPTLTLLPSATDTAPPPEATTVVHPALPPPPADDPPLPDQVIVQFAENTTAAQQAAYIAQIGGTVSSNIDNRTVVIAAPDITPDSLPPSDMVTAAEPNYRVYAQGIPNDPQYPNQWALPVIHAPSAWDELPASPTTVVVAVIDSGICSAHPDLQGRILPGWDYVQGDKEPEDSYGHGCAVSGIIAANTDNYTGIAGIAPNVAILPLRVLDSAGNGSFANLAAAIRYAADYGANIINLSLGSPSYSSTLEAAVNYAADRGVLIIAAAGNTSGGAVMYPAAFTRVVAVGSVDSSLRPSSFSAVGPQIDTWAPGGSILTTQINNDYGYWNGTSFASPMVAGVASLEIALGRSLVLNGGIIAVNLPPTPTPTFTPTPDPLPIRPFPVVVQNITLTDDWAVKLYPGSNASTVASALGYTNLGAVSSVADWYIFRVSDSSTSPTEATATKVALTAHPAVQQVEQLSLHRQFSRTPDDEPLYTFVSHNEQWHLRSDASLVPPLLNINLPLAQWVAGTVTGAGVQIAIVDDGLQYTHPDLAPNYNATGSYDFNDKDSDPSPDLTSNPHGTAAAGLAAAADNPASDPPNYNYCGVGVAYGASLAGIRLTAGSITASTEAEALRYQPQLNDIYSSSWGSADDGSTLQSQPQIVRDALAEGVATGRGGLGSIYVWAAGNGRQGLDNINADEYANSRYVIAVGDTSYAGTPSLYSESGAAMLVTALGNDSGRTIVTTDLLGSNGYNYGPTDSLNGCTNSFTGTSAATPMVAGVVALMLQANPNLTWRDVQHILVETARSRLAGSTGWTTNSAGYDIHNDFGFGVVDAAAAVTLASTWTSVASETSYASPVMAVNLEIPESANGTGGIISSFTLPANIKVEHVEVIFNATHNNRGDIEVNLTAPSGTVSQLMAQRPYDQRRYNPSGDDGNYTDWRFMTVRDWGEHVAGTWTLRVVDRLPGNYTGTFQNWQIIVYGTATSPRTPALTAPATGSAPNAPLPNTPVNFTWDSAHVYATRFELQIDTQNPPASTPLSIAAPASSYTTSLPYGTYYWRLRAIGTDGNGGELTSNWSEVRNFTLASAANAAPLINADMTAQPALTWNRITNAARYEFRLSTSATMTGTPLIYVTDLPPNTTSFTPDSPLAAGVYYWQVRACTSSAAASCGEWSSAVSLVRIDP